ncbi:MAG: hypothetical protein KTR14_07010 [Vampirovibrio sp.]|nr:hypothetical protein [Vampirovibrio sp.]
MLAPTLNYLRTHNTVDFLFRESVGNSLPRVLIVRNGDEFLDQATNQLGLLGAFFGTGYVMNTLVEKLTGGLQQKLSKPGKEWYRFGKSFSIFAMASGLLFAMPFFRNYVTTKRTGTTDYAQMIGEKTRQKLDQRVLNQKVSHSRNQFLTIAATGASISTAILLSSLALARRGVQMPKLIQWLHRRFSLKEGNIGKLPLPSAVVFGTAPIFGAAFAASRDIYEKKEVALRFVGFTLSFFVFPRLVEKAVARLAKSSIPPKWLGDFRNVAYVGKVLSTLLFCSTLTNLANIYMTRRRVKRDMTKTTFSPFLTNPQNYTPLNRRPLIFTAYS